jgi:hypothetical protein
MTKSSVGRRERRLARKLGRPKGSHRSLFKDRRRFAIAMWHAFKDAIGSHGAARLAVVLLEETTPIRTEDLEGLLVVAGADYLPPAPNVTLDEYAFDLARRAKLVTDRATEQEQAWLIRSAGALRGLVGFIASNNVAGAA